MRKFLAGFGYAFRGIADFLRTERNGRIHVVLAALAVGLGGWLRIDRSEWLFIILCIGMVTALEAMNTALEHLTNLVSPDYHPLAGRAKDVAAGAVLLAALASAVGGMVIFGPRLGALLGF